jgi:uncharacterized integral membrane protein
VYEGEQGRLPVANRVAVFVFLICFFGQALAPLILVALGTGFSTLVLAWLLDRIQIMDDLKSNAARSSR